MPLSEQIGFACDFRLDTLFASHGRAFPVAPVALAITILVKYYIPDLSTYGELLALQNSIQTINEASYVRANVMMPMHVLHYF